MLGLSLHLLDRLVRSRGENLLNPLGILWLEVKSSGLALEFFGFFSDLEVKSSGSQPSPS